MVSSDRLVIGLSDASARDPAIVGGKAASLATLRTLLRVPPGFCITTEALLRSENGDSASWSRVAAAVRVRLAGLQGPFIARSSATAEDSRRHSFAGVFESVADLHSAGEVMEAIDQCAASRLRPRAGAYTAAHGLHGPDVRMSVLVQEQVLFDVAGVAFSRRAGGPTGENSLLIEFAEGGAAAVVLGSVVPTRIWAPIVSPWRRIRIANCVVDGRITPEKAVLECVSWAALSCERIFGFPVDMEWGLSGGDLFVVQVRPISAVGDSQRDSWEG